MGCPPQTALIPGVWTVCSSQTCLLKALEMLLLETLQLQRGQLCLAQLVVQQAGPCALPRGWEREACLFILVPSLSQEPMRIIAII